MDPNQFVDTMLIRMSDEEQRLLAWLSKNHAPYRMTHIWQKVVRWVIDYRDSAGKPRQKKPLTRNQFRRLRTLVARSELYSVSSPNIAVIKLKHCGHVYVYAYKLGDLNLLTETLQAQVDDDASPLSGTVADRIFVEATRRL